MSNEWIIGGNAVDRVYVTVLIKPMDNFSPIVEIGDSFTVIEGNKSLISTFHLNITDIDTSEEDVICTIIDQPSHGYVENFSPAPGSERPRKGIPVTAFSAADVIDDYISYVQSIHKGLEPIDDKFTFSCSDGINTSPTMLFPIQIEPSNDEVPEIYMREFYSHGRYRSHY
ncbi:FRAS1-related extracellular matrix protein 2 [Caerostris extrusa]|uniref:FRAS1-related extracellular matrix protein 2 n=1 Tax=Caerostris extrusa TaxID=172846 RepID=A0AAV4NQU5_CAEEX|nr:FRAS1-related extracellular matrix protein 2 [Caerostris extrusa]